MEENYGRLTRIFENEVSSNFIIGIKNKVCYFCGNTRLIKLPNGNKYCPDCIKYGRTSNKTQFIFESDPGYLKKENYKMTWDGILTESQLKISREVMSSIGENKNHLVWAVTGAGKTETIFPVIEHAIKKGKRIAWAAPRLDVIFELIPRIKNAFKDIEISAIYGGHIEKYQRTQITIATTHQLIKFKEAFDLLIIDEVDSFPLVDNPVLKMAYKRSIKNEASIIYLSATPTEELIRHSKKKFLNTSFLSKRFHGFLLPQIKIIYGLSWDKKIPKKVFKVMDSFINKKKSFLVFVPEIKFLIPVIKEIENKLQLKGETVWSGDENRKEKIESFRKNEINFLVTTTILERGVTFPEVQIIILGADDKNFNKNALIQIAGRAGRSKNDPNGEVIAVIKQKNKNLTDAIKQIDYMNKLGAV